VHSSIWKQFRPSSLVSELAKLTSTRVPSWQNAPEDAEELDGRGETHELADA
jgi:hypothetical protein